MGDMTGQWTLRDHRRNDVKKSGYDRYGNASQEKTIIDHNLAEQPMIVNNHGPSTQRHLRNYQVTMIGFCSGIGVGLFVGTGAAYAKAGPVGLLLAYIIVGSVLWSVMQSIGELTTVFPTSGTFPH